MCPYYIFTKLKYDVSRVIVRGIFTLIALKAILKNPSFTCTLLRFGFNLIDLSVPNLIVRRNGFTIRNFITTSVNMNHAVKPHSIQNAHECK